MAYLLYKLIDEFANDAQLLTFESGRYLPAVCHTVTEPVSKEPAPAAALCCLAILFHSSLSPSLTSLTLYLHWKQLQRLCQGGAGAGGLGRKRLRSETDGRLECRGTSRTQKMSVLLPRSCCHPST